VISERVKSLNIFLSVLVAREFEHPAVQTFLGLNRKFLEAENVNTAAAAKTETAGGQLFENKETEATKPSICEERNEEEDVPATEPASSTPAGSSSFAVFDEDMANVAEHQWCYQDPGGVNQGPFTAMQLYAWKDRLPANLLLWKQTSSTRCHDQDRDFSPAPMKENMISIRQVLTICAMLESDSQIPKKPAGEVDAVAPMSNRDRLRKR